MASDEQKQVSALEHALRSGESPEGDLAGLVALAKRLEEMPDPTIDASFADRLEAKLLGAAAAKIEVTSTTTVGAVRAAATVASQPAANVIRFDPQRRRTRRTLIAAIAATFLVAFPIAASASVAPGSPAYNVRLAREEARVWGACRIDRIACGFAHLDRANLRVRDLRIVIAREDTRYIIPTARRLRRDMNRGAGSILRARPKESTLRRLATRLDRTSNALVRLVSAAPAETQDEIAGIIASGDLLSKNVMIALGEPTSSPPSILPPIELDGPVVVQPPAPRPPDQNGGGSGKETQTRKPKTKKPDRFGPGGTTTPVKPRPPGENWESDAVEDSCPLAAVSGPGVDQACMAVRG